MGSRLAVMIVIATVSPMASVADKPEPSTSRESKTSKKKEAQRNARLTSLTGCIDEEDGQYVLMDERTRRTIAPLQAASFPQEGFAKYLGHKVTVRGTMPQSGDRPLFQVRSVEKISDVCAAPQEAK